MYMWHAGAAAAAPLPHGLSTGPGGGRRGEIRFGWPMEQGMLPLVGGTPRDETGGGGDVAEIQSMRKHESSVDVAGVWKKKRDISMETVCLADTRTGATVALPATHSSLFHRICRGI